MASPLALEDSDSSTELTTEFRTINGIELHTVVAGDPADPLVVFLHGFPEYWGAWRRQIAPLVESGYRVLVPDQRGYNRSEKPRGVRAYRQPQLAADIAGLIESEGTGSAHVVGHDWGGMVAWDLALRYPEYVNRLTIANAPHPTAFRQHLLSNPAQIRRSWYATAFRYPGSPSDSVGTTTFDSSSARSETPPRRERSPTTISSDIVALGASPVRSRAC